MPAPDRAHRDVGLDALRGIAVLLVVLNHQHYLTSSRPEDTFWWLTGGWLGVDLFFALSGFFIGTILLRAFLTTGRTASRPFWGRRAARLLPALVVFLIVWTVLAWTPTIVGPTLIASMPGTDYPPGPVTVSGWAATVTGMQNWWMAIGAAYPDVFRHLWSLAIEWQFYALAPLILGALFAVAARARNPRRVLLVILVAMIALAAGTHTLMALNLGPVFGYLSLLGRAPALLAGVTAAVAVSRRLPGGPPVAPGRHALWLLPAVGLALGVMWATARQESTEVVGILLPIAGVLSGLLVWLVSSVGWRGQTASTLAWFGQRSYSAYLYNFPIVVVLATLMANQPVWLVAAAMWASTWLVAAVSWRLTERRTFGAVRGR